MTSVPKPLKFLRPFYDDLGKVREGWAESLKEQRVSGLTVTRTCGLWEVDRGSWIVYRGGSWWIVRVALSLTPPRSLSSHPYSLSSR
jgi:hypothetical protein